MVSGSLKPPANAVWFEELGDEYLPYRAAYPEAKSQSKATEAYSFFSSFRPPPLTLPSASEMVTEAGDQLVVLDKKKFREGMEFFRDFPPQSLVDISKETWLPTMLGVTTKRTEYMKQKASVRTVRQIKDLYREHMEELGVGGELSSEQAREILCHIFGDFALKPAQVSEDPLPEPLYTPPRGKKNHELENLIPRLSITRQRSSPRGISALVRRPSSSE